MSMTFEETAEAAVQHAERAHRKLTDGMGPLDQRSVREATAHSLTALALMGVAIMKDDEV